MHTRCLLAIAGALFSGLASPAENIFYPSDAGVVDVSKPPYNAIPNDGKDDAPGIQRALNDHVSGNHIFYFPNGTYDISDVLLKRPKGDPLRCTRACLELRKSAKRNIFVGQSENKVVLRLMKSVPKEFGGAVLWFGSRPAQRFRNSIRHLTISVGTGHPLATGILFNASNQGGMRHVTIQSEDPSGAGAVGLDLAHTDEVGPLLIQHLTVRGFDRGIRCAFQTASQTFEHVTLLSQREYGWTNGFSQSIFVRGLRSRGEVTVIRNGPTLRGDPGQSKLLLTDAELRFTGKGKPPVAIRNQKAEIIRNVKATGFHAVVSRELAHGRGNATVQKSPLKEFLANGAGPRRRGGPFTLFDSPPQSLNLKVKEAPHLPWEQRPKKWKGPQHFRSGKSGLPNDPFDDTPSIQAAIDSGETTVYLPRGTWRIQGKLILRKNVRHFLGCEAWLVPVRGKQASVILGKGDEPVVLVEGLESGKVRYEHASRRTLHLRNILGGHYSSTQRGQQGELFLTDVAIGPIIVEKGQKLWARQLNVEKAEAGDLKPGAKILNRGGTAWVLGLKTEDEGTVIKTIEGGRTELLGHLHVGRSGKKPRFVTIDSLFSAAIVVGSHFPTNAVEVRGKETRKAEFFQHADLYVGYPK